MSTDKELDDNYWNNRYKTNETGWDLGSVSTPLKEYIDLLKSNNKEHVRILIPGAGNAHEAEYLHSLGFENVTVVDFSELACTQFKERVNGFPADHVKCIDFFELSETYDIILEQTFFCALNPTLRGSYVNKMHELLVDQGVLTGLLFGEQNLIPEGPPFGGTIEEYKPLFEEKFRIEKMEIARNSIAPRQGKELWVRFEKK